jgi:hypothetical protein
MVKMKSYEAIFDLDHQSKYIKKYLKILKIAFSLDDQYQKSHFIEWSKSKLLHHAWISTLTLQPFIIIIIIMVYCLFI